jgi:hypothetical protein
MKAHRLSYLLSTLGSLAMAACGSATSPTTTPSEPLEDARVLPWTPTKDAAGEHASGDVAWSQSEQKGFLRFQGLAANDKTKAQYQLWLFDKTQDYPVDGGVFDAVPSSAGGEGRQGEVVVPVHSQLPVGAPTLFAVTVETPGAVVVSKHERIVVTAKAEAG